MSCSMHSVIVSQIVLNSSYSKHSCLSLISILSLIAKTIIKHGHSWPGTKLNVIIEGFKQNFTFKLELHYYWQNLLMHCDD